MAVELTDEIYTDYLAYERDFSTKKRQSMDKSDFGDPQKRAFPVQSQSDLDNAARLIGHADNPDAVKKNLIAIAKRKGLTLPATWQAELDAKKGKPEDDEDCKDCESSTQESVALTNAPVAPQPKTRIARMKVCFIEDGAISLNGRQYPQQAVDQLIASAQRQLQDPNALPITCYISHTAAENDNSMHLAGRISEVWREGIRGMAWIDLANTEAGRTMATLGAGGFLKSESLRADGAQMTHDRNSTFPQVGGTALTLKGIDFTTMPGLDQVARIESVIFESGKSAPVQEIFNFHSTQMIVQEETVQSESDASLSETHPRQLSHREQQHPVSVLEEAPQMPTRNAVEHIPPMASGVTSGTDDSTPGSAYAQKMMPVQTPTITTDDALAAIKEAHDRSASMLNLECAPSKMESRARRELQEAGRKLSQESATHIAKIHDSAAKAHGLACEGHGMAKVAGKFAPAAPSSGGNDNDGDEDDNMESVKMTPERAAQLLEAAGWSVARPKTQAEVLQEQINELKALILEQAAQAQVQAQAQVAETHTPTQEVVTPVAAVQPIASTPGQVQVASTMVEAQGQGQQVAPQRKSVVEGAGTSTAHRPSNVYRQGDYLRERLSQTDLEQLADRTYAWPSGLDPKFFLQEIATWQMALYDRKYGLDD